MQDDAQRRDSRRSRAEPAGGDQGDEAFPDRARQELGGGVRGSEFRQLVEIAVAERLEHLAQRLRGEADVHHQPVAVEGGPAELRVHDVGRAVEPLRGAENRALEAVGDHDVVADADAVHRQELLGCGNQS
jgi:hypothetical protein